MAGTRLPPGKRTAARTGGMRTAVLPYQYGGLRAGKCMYAGGSQLVVSTQEYTRMVQQGHPPRRRRRPLRDISWDWDMDRLPGVYLFYKTLIGPPRYVGRSDTDPLPADA